MMKYWVLWICCAVQLCNAQGAESVSGDDFDLSFIPKDQDAGEVIINKMLAAGSEFTYRKDHENQKLWIFKPQDLKPGEKRPCIFFIHGGAWGGHPSMFAPQCLYFSQRGMIAVTIHFRNAGNGPKNCLADTRSAYRWIKEHAKEHQIDSDRIVIAGGSAGAHLALSLLTISLEGTENEGDNQNTPIDPKALILYNPAIDLVDGWKGGRRKCEKAGLDPKSFSPAHHVKSGLPETLILSGSEDHIFTPQQIHDFMEKMEQLGNKTTFIEYPDVGHSFFNYHKQSKYPGGDYFIKTSNDVEAFLKARGFMN